MPTVDSCSRVAVHLAGQHGRAHVRSEARAAFQEARPPECLPVRQRQPIHLLTKARGGFTQLSSWWASLGIRIVRSRPGCASRTTEVTRRMHRGRRPRAAASAQSRCAHPTAPRWTAGAKEFNHRAATRSSSSNKTPAEVYKPSERKLRPAKPFTYPAAFSVRSVDISGHAYWHGERCYVGIAFGGHHVEALSSLSTVFAGSSGSAIWTWVSSSCCRLGFRPRRSRRPRKLALKDQKNNKNSSKEVAA